MLPGLSALEVGRLRMSVGYGTHKKGRPLSPAEVGRLFQRARDAGASLPDCAKAVGFKGTSQVARFLNVLDLSPDLLHLVTWGRTSDAIGFTTAVELARIRNPDAQRTIAAAVLEQGLHTNEVRAVAQLQRRSGRPVQECLREVLGMRTSIKRLYVFMGAIVDDAVRATLAEQTQEQRNKLLRSGLEALGVDAAGRLGEQFFTLVGDERLNTRLQKEGRETIESHLRSYLKRTIGKLTRER